MSNQPDIRTNRVLSIRVSREVYRKLQKDAEMRKMQFSEYVRFLAIRATETITLELEDFEIIDQERKQALKVEANKRRDKKT